MATLEKSGESRPASPLQGKVALVTGAGKNIGRCIALTLARDGATIVVNGRSDSAAVESVVREIEGAGGKAMTAEVVVCDPDDSIDQVMAVMTSGRFRHLPVVRRGELYGLVSIGDVVKARLEDARHEAEALKAYIVAS